MTEELELKFSLTKDDLCQFLEFRESRTPQPKFDLATLKSSLLVALMIAVLWLLTTKRSLLESIAISLIFASAIAFVFFSIYPDPTEPRLTTTSVWSPA